jgi:hypothetical protein
MLKKMDKPRIGILEAACINELYTFRQTVIVDALIVYALSQTSEDSLPIILDNVTIHITTTMTAFVKVIIA